MAISFFWQLKLRNKNINIPDQTMMYSYFIFCLGLIYQPKSSLLYIPIVHHMDLLKYCFHPQKILEYQNHISFTGPIFYTWRNTGKIGKTQVCDVAMLMLYVASCSEKIRFIQSTALHL